MRPNRKGYPQTVEMGHLRYRVRVLHGRIFSRDAAGVVREMAARVDHDEQRVDVSDIVAVHLRPNLIERVSVRYIYAKPLPEFPIDPAFARKRVRRRGGGDHVA